MTGLIVIFIDKKEKKFTIYCNQNSYVWTKIFNNLNAKEYAMKQFGGSRKEINCKSYIQKLKIEGFRENIKPIDFGKITGCV